MTADAGYPHVPGYEVLGVLGRGGFATVYRATQTSVGREVALKVLSGGAIDANAERRFRHEVAAVGKLSDHEHVVSVYDVGTTPDGLPFIAMQLVTGGSLADRVRAEGALPSPEVARVGAEVADALEAAHEAGILHRDIKPDNILVGRRGRCLLTDFGIATLSDATRTATGMITGTLPFTAPEVFQGERPSPATDVYALGATLYTLAAARMAFFTGEEHAATVMWRIANDPPPPLPAGVPFDLAEVIDACLAKEARDRPTLPDLLARLETLAAPSAVPTPLPTPLPGAAPPTPGPPPPRQTPARLPSEPLPTVPPTDSAETLVAGAGAGGAASPETTDAATRIAPPRTGDVAPGGPGPDDATVVQGAGPGGGEKATGDPGDAATIVQTPGAGTGGAPGDPGDAATIVQTPGAADRAPGPALGKAAPQDAATVVQPPGGETGDAATVVQPGAAGADDRAGAGSAVDDGATRVQAPGPGSGPPATPGAPGAHGSPPAPPGPPRPSDRPGRSKAPLLIGIGVVLVLVLIAGAAVALLGGGGDDGDGGSGGAAAGGGGDATEIAVGTAPAGVAAGDGTIWVTNSGDGTVTRIATDGSVGGTTTVGGNPGAVVAGAAGVWVANQADATLSRIDPDSGEVLATPAVGDAPGAMASNGAYVYVVNTGDIDLAAVDPSTDEYAADVPLSPGLSWVTANDDLVYVATAGDDGTNQATAFSTDLADTVGGADLPAEPSGAVATADGLWVALGASSEVVRIDASGVIVATIAVGGTLGPMVRDGDDVWVADLDGQRVVRLDVGSDEVAQEVAVGARPEAFAVAGGSVWVPVSDAGVVRRIPT